MVSVARYETHGNVAVIYFNHPPVNGLGLSLREAIVQSIHRANKDKQIKAIVITGSKRAFSAGADVKEFGTEKVYTEPILRTVIAQIENNQKPVVAAVDGVCLGGGLELALSTHFRIAASKARVALPEVTLGIIPGAGGTQRLPRVVGVKKALNMLLTGKMVQAKQLRDTHLFQQVVEEEVVGADIQFAQQLDKAGTKPVRARDLGFSKKTELISYLKEKANEVEKNHPHFPAKKQCVYAVLAGVEKGIDEGLKTERQYFVQLMDSPQAAALRYLFAADRAAYRVPTVTKDTVVKKVHHVFINGRNQIAANLAQNFVHAGFEVFWTPDMAKLQSEPEKSNWLIDTTEILKEQNHLNIDGLNSFITEDATYLSTCAQGLAEVAKLIQRETKTLGLYSANEIFSGNFWEIGQLNNTQPTSVATAIQLGRQLGKKLVVTQPKKNAVIMTMFNALWLVARSILTLGDLSESQFDSLLEEFGFSIGPFAAAKKIKATGVFPLLDNVQTFGRDHTHQNALSEQQIVFLCMAVLANQGAYLYAQGQINKLSDIDVLSVHGLGIGAHIGGPMHYTESQGLKKVVQALNFFKELAPIESKLWMPAPLLLERVKTSNQWAVK